MKTVFLVRHGKAEPGSPKGDFQRDLTSRGRDDAEETGKRIGKLAKSVDVIVSSDAVRAIATARIVAKALGHTSLIVEDHAVYDASIDDLLSVIRDLPDEFSSAVLVGHNPGLEGLLYVLTANKQAISSLKPATMAHLELDIERWRDAADAIGRLIGVHSP